MKLKVNIDRDDLYCIYSKERIEVNENYLEVKEFYQGEEIIKEYKLEYVKDLDFVEFLPTSLLKKIEKLNG